MSIVPGIEDRRPGKTSTRRRPSLSLEGGSAASPLRSSLESNQGRAAIQSSVDEDAIVQGTFSSTGVVERVIEPLLDGEGNDVAPIVGTCATCGRPLTQVGSKGECLRCLVSLGFLNETGQSEKSETSRRLTPGRLKYDHFAVEVGADGFPVELGAGAMAITYRARDTVLNSIVALKVIDRKV